MTARIYEFPTEEVAHVVKCEREARQYQQQCHAQERFVTTATIPSNFNFTAWADQKCRDEAARIQREKLALKPHDEWTFKY